MVAYCYVGHPLRSPQMPDKFVPITQRRLIITTCTGYKRFTAWNLALAIESDMATLTRNPMNIELRPEMMPKLAAWITKKMGHAVENYGNTESITQLIELLNLMSAEGWNSKAAALNNVRSTLRCMQIELNCIGIAETMIGACDAKTWRQEFRKKHQDFVRSTIKRFALKYI